MKKTEAIKKIRKCVRDVVRKELRNMYVTEERHEIVDALVNYAKESLPDNPLDEHVDWVIKSAVDKIRELA